MRENDADAVRALKVAFAGLSALAVAMGVGRFAFTPILPMMQVDAGLSIADGGWLASANYAGYLAGALSAIFIRVPAVLAIRGGLVAIGIVTLAMGLTHDFALWAVLRFLAGVTSAWVLVSVSAWSLERLAQLHRPALSGTVYAGVGAGVTLAGLVCLLLMSLDANSADAWIALGVISFAATALIWTVFVPVHQPVDHAASKSAPGASTAELLLLVICYGAYGFGYIIPATFLPVMAKAAIADPRLFGWAWPAFGAAAVASTLFAARLQRTMSFRAIWIASHWVMALGVVVPLVVPGLAGIALAAVCVGSTFVVVTMAGVQEARVVAGARAHALIAAMTAAFGVGQIAGPLTVRLFAGGTTGFSEALLFAAAVLVASALMLMWVRPR
jgi:predicted MFS family arabinose efflux permease